MEQGQDNADAMVVQHKEIAIKFIDLYWQQTAPYGSGLPNTTTKRADSKQRRSGRCCDGYKRVQAKEPGSDPVVELFAFLHDSKRLNEDKDPEHGLRAASFATQLNGRYFQLDSFQLDVLCHAMTHHSHGAVNADPTIQTCWDADRLD